MDITGLIDAINEEENLDYTEEREVDDSFYTRSMDLSEHDFDFDEETERKTSIKRNILIFIVTVVLIAVFAIIGYFLLEHFGINIKELI